MSFRLCEVEIHVELGPVHDLPRQDAGNDETVEVRARQKPTSSRHDEAREDSQREQQLALTSLPVDPR